MTATKPCPTCRGSGRVPDLDAACGATITVGHETFECWANRAHPGWSHMLILSSPCAACGGYEEHDASCAVYPAEPPPDGRDGWYEWDDGDLAVRYGFPISGRAGNGDAWRRVFSP